MEDSKKNKGERILLCIFLLMMAVVIGYDAFYVKNMSGISVKSEKVISANHAESKLAEENESLEKENFVINLNSASETELQKLKGVGRAISKRIVEYRETHGGFAKVEEIMNVKGIGENFFKKIKDNICV